MTPAEHITRAEQLLEDAAQTDDPLMAEERAGLYTAALAHAVIAIAVEMGVPHAGPASAVPGG